MTESGPWQGVEKGPGTGKGRCFSEMGLDSAAQNVSRAHSSQGDRIFLPFLLDQKTHTRARLCGRNEWQINGAKGIRVSQERPPSPRATDEETESREGEMKTPNCGTSVSSSVT